MAGLSIVAGGAGRYITYGVIQISMANLIIIGTMVLVFVLALVVPFGSGQDHKAGPERRKP
jgi:ABC-type proline/glycine betaine transport system permease subunit